MKNVLIFLFMPVQIILISAQQCLTISGSDSEYWLLCFENVTNSNDAKAKCYGLTFLELLTQYNTTETWYSWFNKKISIQNQINELNRVFEMNLNNLIDYESYRIEEYRCNIDKGFDKFTQDVTKIFLNFINSTQNSSILNNLNSNLVTIKNDIIEVSRQTIILNLTNSLQYYRNYTMNISNQIKGSLQDIPFNENSIDKIKNFLVKLAYILNDLSGLVDRSNNMIDEFFDYFNFSIQSRSIKNDNLIKQLHQNFVQNTIVKYDLKQASESVHLFFITFWKDQMRLQDLIYRFKM